MFVRIGGRPIYPWQAVDLEDEVLEVAVQTRCDAAAARRLMRELLGTREIAPTAWITDRCPAHGARFVTCGWTEKPTCGLSG
jgi:transposase-like protein